MGLCLHAPGIQSSHVMPHDDAVMYGIKTVFQIDDLGVMRLF